MYTPFFLRLTDIESSIDCDIDIKIEIDIDYFYYSPDTIETCC